MCFVACHKQSFPAHYIYNMSGYSCNPLRREKLCESSLSGEEGSESYKLFKVALVRFIPDR